jgi:hypothetical protein
MIIVWLEEHYFYFVALLLLIAIIKVLSASAFFHREDGITGIIFILFRWFTPLDYHVSNTPWKVKNRKYLNGISILFYFTLILLLIITIVIKVFG